MNSPIVERVAQTSLPTAYGTFSMIGFRDQLGHEHVALVAPDTLSQSDSADVPLVRLHSECLTGDALGSQRCDCGEQLQTALEVIARRGSGAVLYLRGHEGRGIGLLEKLKAYALQDRGVDTVDANLELGHPADARDYTAAAAILVDLGLTRLQLLSSNPAKEEALTGLGIDVVSRAPLFVPEHAQNARYLATKRARMAHDVPDLSNDVWQLLLSGRVPAEVSGSSERELVEIYGALASSGQNLVLAQLATSLDGFIASSSGDANYVSGTADRIHLHRMRALVDAVVVGAGTVCADNPQLTVRDAPGRNPVRVVLDPQGRVPLESTVLSSGAAPTIWITGGGISSQALADHVTHWVMPLTQGRIAPDAIVKALQEAGHGRILVEGGGMTVSSFLEAGLIECLSLTSSPVLIGDGVPGLRFQGSPRLGDALRPPVRRFSLGDDLLTQVWFQAAGVDAATT